MKIELLKYRPEDGGILDCWFDYYGADRMYTAGFNKWYTWTGTHWAVDESLTIFKEIEKLLDQLNRAATRSLSEAHAELAAAGESKDAGAKATAKVSVGLYSKFVSATTRSKNRIASIEAMARARCGVPSGKLNTCEGLNLANGTLDIGTLTMREHNRGDLFTYVMDNISYDADAVAPTWGGYLFSSLVKERTDEETTWQTDYELCALAQEAFGYSLTTDTKHEAMFWMKGEGANGKTVMITMLRRLLGPLAKSVDFVNIGKTGNYDLASVAGKRAILSTEAERGGLAEGTIKQIVSGETINARPIYGEGFDFDPFAKIWWSFNDAPVIRDKSNGIWRRLKLIPFNRTFIDGVDKDIHLITKLEAELPGILNWALAGLRRLRANGHFTESAAVNEAVSEYRSESNPVAQWLAEHAKVVTEPNTYPTLAGVAYSSYKEWAGINGRELMNSTTFGLELKRLVGWKRKTEGKRYAIRLNGSM
jgi:putative DNA primase/helicase